MTQILDLRPVHHRLEDRIRTHVTLCWLAPLLIRIIETSTGGTWNNTRRELQRLHVGYFTGPAIAASVSDPRSWDQAFRVLEGSWIRLTATSRGPVDEASLFDPSRRDFLLGLLRRDGFVAQVLDRVVGTDQTHYVVRLGGLLTRNRNPVMDGSSENGIGQAVMREATQLCLRPYDARTMN